MSLKHIYVYLCFIQLFFCKILMTHYDVMPWKYLPHYWHLHGESPNNWWIPLTKGYEKLWSFLCILIEPVEQTVKFPLIWVAIMILWDETPMRHQQLNFIQQGDFSQILQCLLISHNAPLFNRNMHKCAHFCYNVMHCGICIWCIVGLPHNASNK